MSEDEGKVRLVDIAKKAGVSRTAVGHILNNSGADCVRVSKATRQKVLRIARELDYRPNRAAQRLRGMPTQIIGVILDTVNLAVFSARLAAIEAEAHRRGYRLMIGQAHHDPKAIKEYLDDFEDHGMDAILCLFDVMHDIRPRLKGVFRGRKNIILHSAPILNSHPCVRVETSSAIELLVDHLADRGRERVAIQLWSPADHLMSIRAEAWKANVIRRKLASADSLVWTNPEATQKPSREAIADCIHKLIIKNRADAVIASNDEWAVRIMQGLQAQGYSVPGDIAVTGYDNLEIADVIEPGLTTIDQCHADYAKQALDLVQESLAGTLSSAQRIRVIKPKLVVRGST